MPLEYVENGSIESIIIAEGGRESVIKRLLDGRREAVSEGL
jgi:hypothetical protein